MNFAKIKDINLKDKETWENKIFLTFDLDWCSDEVLSHTLDVIEQHNLQATFFVTHNTALLARMRENPNIELGIHPNFNFLLLDSFAKSGLKFDCNIFIPFDSQIALKPWKHWNDNIIKIPYFWEDDVHCIYKWSWDINKFLQYQGIKVFDFHPIHIFLNTEDMRRYDNARPYLQDYGKLEKFVNNDSHGTRDFF